MRAVGVTVRVDLSSGSMTVFLLRMNEQLDMIRTISLFYVHSLVTVGPSLRYSRNFSTLPSDSFISLSSLFFSHRSPYLVRSPLFTLDCTHASHDVSYGFSSVFWLRKCKSTFEWVQPITIACIIPLTSTRDLYRRYMYIPFETHGQSTRNYYKAKEYYTVKRTTPPTFSSDPSHSIPTSPRPPDCSSQSYMRSSRSCQRKPDGASTRRPRCRYVARYGLAAWPQAG